MECYRIQCVAPAIARSAALTLRIVPRRNRIKTVGVLPGKFFAGRNVHFNIWLGRNHSPYRPHSQVRERSIAVDIDTHARFPVFHPDLVVRSAFAESGKLSVESIATLEVLGKI